MTVTLRDVAAKAGVSAITVSRALNNTGYVNPQTRQRIYDAVAILNYVPNDLASSLRSKRTQLLALLVTDVTNPFWTTVARGAEDSANRQGYHVIVGNTDKSQAKQDEYLSFLAKKQVDGFLVVPVHNTSPSLDLLYKLRALLPRTN